MQKQERDSNKEELKVSGHLNPRIVGMETKEANTNTGTMIKMVFKWMRERNIDSVQFTDKLDKTTMSFETISEADIANIEEIANQRDPILPMDSISESDLDRILNQGP